MHRLLVQNQPSLNTSEFTMETRKPRNQFWSLVQFFWSRSSGSPDRELFPISRTPAGEDFTTESSQYLETHPVRNLGWILARFLSQF